MSYRTPILCSLLALSYLLAPRALAVGGTDAVDVDLDYSHLDLTADNVQDAFEQLPGRVFNVLDDDFAGGATPDDATDDSDAFEAAIEAADALPCGTVFVPPGVYDLGDWNTVAIYDCVRIIGAGAEASIIDGDDTTKQFLHADLAAGASPPAMRFHMEGVQIRDWNASFFVKQNDANVDALLVRDNIFDKVRASSNVGEIFTHNSETTGAYRFDNVLMDGNLIRNGSNGLLDIHEPDFKSVIVRNNTYIDGIGFGFVSVGHASNDEQSGVVIVGNVVKDMDTSGTNPQQFVFGGKTRGLIVIGNVVENVTADGGIGDGAIHFQGASSGDPGDIVIANNVIIDYSMDTSGAEGAITLKGEANRAIIANNVIRTRDPAGRGMGIQVTTGPATIVGNYLERLQGGIDVLEGFDGLVIADNTLIDIDFSGTGGDAAIELKIGSNTQITGNVLDGISKGGNVVRGITVKGDVVGASNLRIAGNVLRDIVQTSGTSEAILLHGNGEDFVGLVIENNLIDDVGYGISQQPAGDVYSDVHIHGNVYRNLNIGRYRWLDRLVAPVSIHDDLEQTCQRFDSPSGVSDLPVLLGFDYTQRIVSFRCAAFGGGDLDVDLWSGAVTAASENCDGTPVEYLIDHDLDASDVLFADFGTANSTVDSAMVCLSY